MTMTGFDPEAGERAVGMSKREAFASMLQLAEDYRESEDLRSRATEHPHEVLAERGFPIPSSFEVRIMENTEDVSYFVLPPDPNVLLADEDLDVAVGGKTASTAGTVATASTIGSAISTASTAASAGTAGSVGCK